MTLPLKDITRLAQIARDAHDMDDFLRERMEEARKSPKQDLTSYVANAEDSGQRLTDREVVTILKEFMIAGNDLTTAAIVNTAYCLASHPDQMRLLANDPSLAANAFEESLRYMGPALMLQRKTTREVDIAGDRFGQ